MRIFGTVFKRYSRLFLIYLVPVYLLLFAASCLHLLHYYPLLPDVLWAQQKGFEAISKQSLAVLYLGFMLFNYSLFLGACIFFEKYPQHLKIRNWKYWLAPERAQASVKSVQKNLTCIGVLLGIAVVKVMDFSFYQHLNKATAADLMEMRICSYAFVTLLICIIVWPFYRFREPSQKP